MTIRARGNVLLTAATMVSLLVSACGREQVAFSDIKTVPANIPEEIRHPCGVEDVTGMTADPGDFPDGVAYPTPSHGNVSPGITDIPTPPDAVQIDGFKITKGRDTAVQVFETSLTQAQVLAFYDQLMLEQGWSMSIGSRGPAGVSCEFAPHPYRGGFQPKNWIVVSTEYIPRPGEEPGTADPPGFRGKGVPFAPRTPGKTTFSLLTPR